MSACSTVTDLGVVRDVLTAVDCNTKSFARLGYESLTATGSPFQAALTVALTIYVAVIGYRLLFGNGARLADGPTIALKIGAVLALVTSWSLFQTLVFDVAERAPIEIAAVISAPLRGSAMAADPVAGLQAAYDQLSQTANAFAHPPKSVPDTAQADYAAASQALTLASNALFIASAGLIAVITIAIGLLTATGPVFIALFLFFETRGFFVGWVRALGVCAFGLISAWSLTVLMLHAVQPWMDILSEVGAGGIADARTGITAAIIVLVFCASQFALLLAGIVIARGFRLPGAARQPAATPAPAVRGADMALPLDMISRPARLAEQLGRGEAPAAYAERAVTAGAAAMAGRGAVAAASPARIGDMYRRPAVTNEARRG
ncbi:MAG: type IV secretion system protein [Alphaproteobacteria bacterium]|nr:type IV secretion system protein [Alphaproteobacteria bacterium]